MGPPVTAESWSYLDPEVLLSSRSVRVCMTCHFFRHHATASGIPLLACHHHGGLITHGEHLTRRCRQWSPDPMARIGWAPEAA